MTPLVRAALFAPLFSALSAPALAVEPDFADGYAGGPAIAVRASGELEVIFPEGCIALYDAAGAEIVAASTCSEQQLQQAGEAVARQLQE